MKVPRQVRFKRPEPPPPRPGRRWLRTIARSIEVALIAGAFGALLLWCSVPDPTPLATRNPTSTAFIDLRRTQAAEAGKKFALEMQWRPLGKISRYLRAAVMYSEDWKFYDHDGVDWDALENAVHTNLAKGSLAIGGSTITQQLAKNLYLSPSKSFVRKLREMLIAFALEDHLSKTRILEIYLNVVEWGDGVFGAEAAAQHWFHHSAQTLTPAEAVRLAIALPNPFTRAPNIRSKALTKKAVRLIRLLRMQGLIDSGQERSALDAVGARKVPTIAKTKKLENLDDENEPDVPEEPAPEPPPQKPVTPATPVMSPSADPMPPEQ